MSAHGHMFALPSFSEPIVSFSRLKPRGLGMRMLIKRQFCYILACSRNIMALWRKTFVTKLIPGAVIRCFISRQLVSAWKWSQIFFNTLPSLPITVFLSLASLLVAQTTDPPSWIQTFFIIAISFLACNLIIGGGEVLEINTTAPSIVNNNCPSCNYNASHEKRSSSSSHGEHLAAVIRFSGNIEFRNGSTVQVFGKYGLSITSQNGHILIETDINMTCTEMVLDETCLGGFTQSSVEPLEDISSPHKKRLYKGKRSCFHLPFSHLHLVCSCFHTYFLGGGYKVW